MSSSSEEDQSSARRHRSSKPSGAHSDLDQPQYDPDPPYYREVPFSDIPSQYAEEVDTFRRILALPDPRESIPRSSTSVMGLDDEKGRQELRPRGPSTMLPLSSVIKDAFDKFEHDFQAANLPEGKYIKLLPSTAKCYKVGQPCYEDKIQELNTDFAKICITPKPSGAPMAKVPLPILRRLNPKSKKVPILRNQPNVDMNKPENIWTSGIRLLLFNTELLHASANPWPIYSRESYILWVTPAC